LHPPGFYSAAEPAGVKLFSRKGLINQNSKFTRGECEKYEDTSSFKNKDENKFSFENKDENKFSFENKDENKFSFDYKEEDTFSFKSKKKKKNAFSFGYGFADFYICFCYLRRFIGGISHRLNKRS